MRSAIPSTRQMFGSRRRIVSISRLKTMQGRSTSCLPVTRRQLRLGLKTSRVRLSTISGFSTWPRSERRSEIWRWLNILKRFSVQLHLRIQWIRSLKAGLVQVFRRQRLQWPMDRSMSTRRRLHRGIHLLQVRRVLKSRKRLQLLRRILS